MGTYPGLAIHIVILSVLQNRFCWLFIIFQALRARERTRRGEGGGEKESKRDRERKKE